MTEEEMVDRVGSAIFAARNKAPMGFIIDGYLARAAINEVRAVLVELPLVEAFGLIAQCSNPKGE